MTNTDNDIAGFTVDADLGAHHARSSATPTRSRSCSTRQPTRERHDDDDLERHDRGHGGARRASRSRRSNWNVPQTVTVTGVNDNLVDGNQLYTIITGAATSGDPAYNGVNPADVSVTNIDNETPQVYVKARPRLKTSESGQSASFRVRLTVAPAAQVVCTLHSSDLTEGTVAPTSLTFTQTAFGFQTVTVTGVDDVIVDGDQLYSIVLDACTSADPAYNGQDPRDVAAINRDND